MCYAVAAIGLSLIGGAMKASAYANQATAYREQADGLRQQADTVDQQAELLREQAQATREEGLTAVQIAYKNAELQRAAGRYEAKTIRKKVAYINQQATAQAGARGLVLSGSVLDVITQNAVEGEIDAAHAVKTANDQAKVSAMQGEATYKSYQNKALSVVNEAISKNNQATSLRTEARSKEIQAGNAEGDAAGAIIGGFSSFLKVA